MRCERCGNYDDVCGCAEAEQLKDRNRFLEEKLAEAERERDGFKAAWQNACERGDAAVARLAEAERLLELWRDAYETEIDDYDALNAASEATLAFQMNAGSASVAPCVWEPSDMWPIMRYQCGPTNSSGTTAGADYKFCPWCGGRIERHASTVTGAP
jgi:hypothetical protein